MWKIIFIVKKILGGHIFFTLLSFIAQTEVNYVMSRLGLATPKSRLGSGVLMSRFTFRTFTWHRPTAGSHTESMTPASHSTMSRI